MSNAPHIIKNFRWCQKLGDAKIVDSMIFDGLWDAYKDFHIGITGEIIGEKYGITREEADEFALSSHQKAVKAIKDGKLYNHF